MTVLSADLRAGWPRASRTMAMKASSIVAVRPASAGACARSSAGVPWASTLPLSRIAARSQYSASAMKWVVTITVTPPAASAVMRCQNSRRAKGSAPLVGSSRKRISGRCRRAAAMARRCLNPPGSCALGRRTKGSSLNWLKAHAIRSRFLSPLKAVGAREEIQVLADRQLSVERKLLRDVAQMLPGRGARSWRTSTPAIVKVPAEAGKSPQSMRNVVVLPAPFGPSRPKISPRLTTETHMVDRDKFAEAPIEIVDLDHGVAPDAADGGSSGWSRFAWRSALAPPACCRSTMNPSSNRAGVGWAATPPNMPGPDRPDAA